MMKQNGYYPRASLGFARLLDADLTPFTTHVVTMTTGNVNYANPNPTLASISTASDKFSELVTKAMSRDKIVIVSRNVAREELLTLMRSLAAYVTSHCNEDVLTLITSGFDAVRVPGPVGPLFPPENLRLSYTGKTGELLFRFKSDRNARNFSIQTAELADGPWSDFGLSTTASVTIDNLTPGKTYWARVSANGTSGSSDWTAPTSMMAV